MDTLALVGHAAAVTQLVGDAFGLIAKIKRAVETARQNKLECDLIARRVPIINGVLSGLPQEPEVVPPLMELHKTLREAHDMVDACRDKSAAKKFFGSRAHADKFREVNERITFDIAVLGLSVKNIIARRQTTTTATVPSPGSSSGYTQTQMAEHVFVTEHDIISPLRHDTEEKDPTMFVYEHGHMSNGTLRDHLLRVGLRTRMRLRLSGGSSSSPVTASWQTRVEVLLGASRAIEHLHRSGFIHLDVSSSNILLDASWTPRLSGFGAVVLQALAAMGEEPGGQVVVMPVYLDPEYHDTRRVSSASNVYSFGVVMLEALTGQHPANLHVNSTLLAIRNGKLRDVLDRRPATPRHLKALDLVAHTAGRCLRPHGKDRTAMPDVVASIEEALGTMTTH